MSKSLAFNATAMLEMGDLHSLAIARAVSVPKQIVIVTIVEEYPRRCRAVGTLLAMKEVAAIRWLSKTPRLCSEVSRRRALRGWAVTSAEREDPLLSDRRPFDPRAPASLWARDDHESPSTLRHRRPGERRKFRARRQNTCEIERIGARRRATAALNTRFALQALAVNTNQRDFRAAPAGPCIGHLRECR